MWAFRAENPCHTATASHDIQKRGKTSDIHFLIQEVAQAVTECAPHALPVESAFPARFVNVRVGMRVPAYITYPRFFVHAQRSLFEQLYMTARSTWTEVQDLLVKKPLISFGGVTKLAAFTTLGTTLPS